MQTINQDNKKKQGIAILGSTGSIGIQTLDVIEQYPELFEVIAISANDNWEKLGAQAIKFNADCVVIANEKHYDSLTKLLEPHPIKVYAGKEALLQIVKLQTVDCVVSALVGYAGLEPTISAIESGKKIALANKETLVVAGEIIMKKAIEFKASILPVDSEHSAIFQCLAGEYSAIEKIILTASGGPFYGYSTKQLEAVTLQQALKHPNWSMGKKITIDSSTMMNKGFEVIEAKWLFGVDVKNIDVFVHRNSVVHSMVQFSDGAIKAQLGAADMRQPILYALTCPYRLPLNSKRLDFSHLDLGFLPADKKTFICLQLAYDAAQQGGNMPCILNAANEVAVAAFLREGISFLDIPRYIQIAMRDMDHHQCNSIEGYKNSDYETRKYINNLISKK